MKKAAPTILYVDCVPWSGMGRVRLAGIRRYAATRGWRVETLGHGSCPPKTLRKALAELRPIGCVAECWDPRTALRPALFGRVPVVYFSPPSRSGWQNAHGVVCNESAVAQMAFRELSDGQPESYAVLSFWRRERWAQERIDAFRECCRKAGVSCQVTYFKGGDYHEMAAWVGGLVPWAAALPPHCAVFAVNDFCAIGAAKALEAAGRSFPRSVTLIGADGIEPDVEIKELVDTISTVRLDFELAGYLAAKMIGEMISRRGAETQSLEFPPLMVDRRKSTRGYGRREPRILEAMDMIRREASDGLTVAKLASRFPGTRRLFEVRFREAAGHSALDEILNVRMARAIELLTNTEMPIEAVANFSGFKTKWEFWHFFRKRTNVPPTRFRKDRRPSGVSK